MIQGMPARLRELRIQNGLSQDAVARLVGKGTATISNYERGERTPVPEVIVKFSQIYHCSTDYILMGKGNEPVYIVEPLPDGDLLGRINRMQKDLNAVKETVLKERLDQAQSLLAEQKGRN